MFVIFYFISDFKLTNVSYDNGYNCTLSVSKYGGQTLYSCLKSLTLYTLGGTREEDTARKCIFSHKCPGKSGNCVKYSNYCINAIVSILIRKLIKNKSRNNIM